MDPSIDGRPVPLAAPSQYVALDNDWVDAARRAALSRPAEGETDTCPSRPDLTGALKKVVLSLEDDLRARVASQPEVDAAWRGLHAQAVDRERTAMSWQAWRDDRVTQAAVAWVLTSVFVRFCEDNRLLRPVWIAGPGDAAPGGAGRRAAVLPREPRAHGPRVAAAGGRAPGVDCGRRGTSSGRTRRCGRSPRRARRSRRCCRSGGRPRDDGSLVWDFTDPELSTRFLGDLYQDLSDYAKKTFALLQTPEFVEEFILDQTMEPALAERPLEGFRMIDPTCGSGHFLLGRVRAAERPVGRAGARAGAAGPGAEGAGCRARRRPQPVRRRDRPVPAHGRRASGLRRDVAGGRAGVHVPPRRRRLAAARRPPAGDAVRGLRRRVRAQRVRLRHRGPRRSSARSSPRAATTSSSATRPTSPSRTRPSTRPTASSTRRARASTR